MRCGFSSLSNGLTQMLHDLAQIALYRIAMLIGCHQRSDRSYFIRGRQIPVCARCLGILIGLVFAPVLRVSLVAAIALVLPMLLDGGTQALGLRGSRNLLRFVTGVGFAIGSCGLMVSACKFLWNT